MADNLYTYQRKRKEFGRPPNFSDPKDGTKIVGVIKSNPAIKNNYDLRNPNTMIFDNIARYSEHSVNTDRVATTNRGMKHEEGGWPKEIDYQEPNETGKWRKKLDRDSNFASSVVEVVGAAESCVLQNNQIDLFQDYFSGETADQTVENVNTKTLMLFKDPQEIKRSVSGVTWHPENPNKVAVSYAVTRFQKMPHKMSTDSYIWDMHNPNEPAVTISPTSSLLTMQFNHRNSDIMVGGCYNGSLAFFDLRRGDSSGVIKPTDVTLLEKSHHDPVYDLCWLVHGRTGNECVSTSTDGRVLWWDNRKLNEGAQDSLELRELVPGETEPKIMGGTSLEYNMDAGPMKYLVGTEQGYILQGNRRPGRPVEVNLRFGLESGKHHGPVYAIQRNPTATKYFLTVGDWQAKIWCEELKTPIMQTRYHQAYLTDGCWSKTRAGVFFLTRMDGWLDVWDFYYRQNEVAFEHKVSDYALTKVSLQEAHHGGSIAAIGDACGTVTLMQLSEPLYISQNKDREKEAMAAIFERESRREKTLEVAKKKADKKIEKKETMSIQKREQAIKESLRKIEEDFFNQLGIPPEERDKLPENSAYEEVKAVPPPGEDSFAKQAEQDIKAQNEPQAPAENGGAEAPGAGAPAAGTPTPPPPEDRGPAEL